MFPLAFGNGYRYEINEVNAGGKVKFPNDIWLNTVLNCSIRQNFTEWRRFMVFNYSFSCKWMTINLHNVLLALLTMYESSIIVERLLADLKIWNVHSSNMPLFLKLLKYCMKYFQPVYISKHMKFEWKGRKFHYQ